jgi:hypothetical protein
MGYERIMGEIISNLRMITPTELPSQDIMPMCNVGSVQARLFSICEENEAATASADSKQPILYARNVHQCMVAIVYDEITHRAGMLHVNVNAMDGAEDGLRRLTQEVRGGNTHNKLQVYIFGCDAPKDPADKVKAEATVVNFVRAVFAATGDCNAKLVCFNVLEDKKDSNLAFDARNGDICYGKKLDTDLTDTLCHTVRTPEPIDLRTVSEQEIVDITDRQDAAVKSARLLGRFPLMHDGFAPTNQQISTRFGGPREGLGGGFNAR